MRFEKNNPRTIDSEKNDCVVRAMTIATGKTYDEIHALLKRCGRRNGCGTNFGIINAALVALGLPELTRIDPDYRLICGRYTARRQATNRPTLAQFVSEHREGTYMLIIRGHAFALINGVQHDGWIANGARCRITHYVRVA
jgi:hypothetical protein